MEYKNDSDINCNLRAQFNQQRIGTGNGGFGKKTSDVHPNYSIIVIGQNTKVSPGDLRRLAVTQTPAKNYQLKLM